MTIDLVDIALLFGLLPTSLGFPVGLIVGWKWPKGGAQALGYALLVPLGLLSLFAVMQGVGGGTTGWIFMPVWLFCYGLLGPVGFIVGRWLGVFIKSKRGEIPPDGGL